MKEGDEMQTYWDLSERLRGALSREDVEHYVDAELMLKGVLRVRAPKRVDGPEMPKPTTRFFSVRELGKYGSKNDLGPLFTSLEDAQRFVALSPLTFDSEWSDGVTVKFAKPCTELEIVEVSVLTEAEMTLHKAQISQAKSIAAANERAQSEYEAAQKKQDDALRGLWADWAENVARNRKLQEIADTFDDYLRVAGDATVASKFLAKVYDLSDIEDAAAWLGKPITVRFVDDVEAAQ